MITVFGRNYYTFSNQYSAKFDGINDYAIINQFNTGQGNPFAITPILGSASSWLCSMWVKMDNTVAINGVTDLWTQGYYGDPNTNTFRIGYISNNAAGNPSNRIFIDFRNNGLNSRVMRQWALQNHTAITGSTSISDQWLAGNTNINTNANGFVHLCVIVNLPAHPGSLTNTATANIKCFWNGQQLTTTSSSVNNGDTVLIDVTDSADVLGGNLFTVPVSANFNGKIDELAGIKYDEYALFKTAKGLTTDASVATYLWNAGVPDNINGGSWGNFWWRFEQSWTTNGGLATNTMFPVNGATFSTDHA